MLSRFRTRFEVRWVSAGPLAERAGGAGVAALLAIALVASLVAGPSTAQAAGVPAARAWLERAQNPDGGYAATPGAASNPAMTGWAMLGLEAAGRNPLDVRRGGASPVGYLRSNIDRLRSTGDLERTILALSGAGVSPRRFGGRDLVAELRSRRDGDGSFDGQVNLTAFGILALRAAGSGDTAAPASWLREAGNGDGGWGFRPGSGSGSDPDSTGAALQGLAAAGGGGFGEGVSYLRRVQRREGGWGLNETGVTNSQSTAWAVQGLVAARAISRTLHRGLRYLDARQSADGHYRYSSSTDQTPIWVTSQVLLAVGGEALPIERVPRSRSGSVVPQPDVGGIDVSGDEAGSGGRKHRGRKDGTNGDTRRDREAPGGGYNGRQAAGATRLASAGASGEPVSESSDDGLGTGAYVGGGLGLLAAALGAGFLWYRRTLP
jgi:energy-coupling factor transport system substrate-specific component